MELEITKFERKFLLYKYEVNINIYIAGGKF
ncbi:hypothetical protein N9414_15582 [Nodularia spumigena CCY9414]|nr:hypothetical protein N9414_15582 [Nodularia spumigena CCY9414]